MTLRNDVCCCFMPTSSNAMYFLSFCPSSPLSLLFLLLFLCIFSRIPISQTFIDMVIGRLRSDDIYNQVHLTSLFTSLLPSPSTLPLPHLSSHLPPPFSPHLTSLLSPSHLPPSFLLSLLPPTSPPSEPITDCSLPYPRAPQHSTGNTGEHALCDPLLCSKHSQSPASSDERDR